MVVNSNSFYISNCIKHGKSLTCKKKYKYLFDYYFFPFTFADDASDFSSKSGTPSPILGGPRVPHGVIASRDLVRDFRESSVHSRSSSHGDCHDDFFREESVPREADQSQRHPSPFNRTANSSLGVSLYFMVSIKHLVGKDIYFYLPILLY